MASCGSCVKFLKFRSHINNFSGINLLFVANDRCRATNEHPDQHPISKVCLGIDDENKIFLKYIQIFCFQSQQDFMIWANNYIFTETLTDSKKTCSSMKTLKTTLSLIFRMLKVFQSYLKTEGIFTSNFSNIHFFAINCNHSFLRYITQRNTMCP